MLTASAAHSFAQRLHAPITFIEDVSGPEVLQVGAALGWPRPGPPHRGCAVGTVPWRHPLCRSV